VYLDPRHDVYDFLQRMEARRIIHVHDVAKPLARIEIARYLTRIDSSKAHLTSVEKEQLEWYKEEFWYELKKVGYDVSDLTGRWNLYSLRSEAFNLNVNAVLGAKAQFNKDGAFTYRYSNGLLAYGYFKDIFGVYFNFHDNREQGDRVDFTRAFTPDQGIVITIGRPPDNYTEFDKFDGYVSLDLGRVQIEAGKDLNVWGHGYRGQLILSTKAPSYPEIKLKVSLTDWLNFAYIHAWLFSNVVDSLLTYGTDLSHSAGRSYDRKIYRDKYLASHILETSVIPGLDVSVGESIIYSDSSPQLIYLIPIMFFRSADHYNRGQDNSQFFLDVKANLIRNIGLYGALFIDEMSLENIFNKDKSRNQLGFQIGTLIVNPLIDNLHLRAEYTRILPWVYSNYIPADTYENNGYTLGHWIGQNADDLYLEANYIPLRSLKLSACYEKLRKGGKKDINYQYNYPSQPFLYGPVRREDDFGFMVGFEPLRDLFATFSARFSSVTDEATNIVDQGSSEIIFSLKYNVFY
jgi:hypothetical protein